MHSGFSLRLHFLVHSGLPQGSWHRPVGRRATGAGGGAVVGPVDDVPGVGGFLVTWTVSKAMRMRLRSTADNEAAQIASRSVVQSFIGHECWIHTRRHPKTEPVEVQGHDQSDEREALTLRWNQHEPHIEERKSTQQRTEDNTGLEST